MRSWNAGFRKEMHHPLPDLVPLGLDSEELVCLVDNKHGLQEVRQLSEGSP